MKNRSKFDHKESYFRCKTDLFSRPKTHIFDIKETYLRSFSNTQTNSLKTPRPFPYRSHQTHGAHKNLSRRAVHTIFLSHAYDVSHTHVLFLSLCHVPLHTAHIKPAGAQSNSRRAVHTIVHVHIPRIFLGS